MLYLIAAIAGATFGALALGLCKASKRADQAEELECRECRIALLRQALVEIRSRAGPGMIYQRAEQALREDDDAEGNAR